MTTQMSPVKPSHICSYQIASSDLYYAEMAQRDIFAYDDPRYGYRIWGELHGQGPKTQVDLCQMLLEYGMYLRSWCSDAEAHANMEDFGTRLGLALAGLLNNNPPAQMDTNPGACALMCVFESMNVEITIQQIGPELHFLLATCPVHEVAVQTGMREVELAHVGVNALCQSLIYAVDPGLAISIPAHDYEEVLYTLTKAV